MKFDIKRESAVSTSYKAERARGLFNVTEEDGCSFSIEANIPIEEPTWRVGVVVGSSGSGKSSIGSAIEEGESLFKTWKPRWGKGPIIDTVGPAGSDFDKVTAVLSSVGLGSVPAWLRPYGVLSNGEKFRADCAALLLKGPKYVIIDEFTSVLDRQVASVGAAAFVKAWRKQGGQLVLLTCHHDVLDWILPDWVFDTDKKQLYVGAEKSGILRDVDQYPEIGRLVVKK